MAKEKEDIVSCRQNAKVKGAGFSTTSDFETKFLMKPNTEQVDGQWARALCKKGLPLDLVDDPEFRAAVLMTARAGLCYVDNSDPLNAEVKLPHRGKMTATTIPALDSDLESKVKTRIQGLLKETGCLLISDG